MSKKQIGIIVALCACLAGLAVAFKMPANTKVAAKPTETSKAEVTAPTLAANRVYVMYAATCQMCAKALDYIDKNEAANPFIERIDLNTERGKALLNACRQKFGFKDVVIPLICADKEYTMGWGSSFGDKIKEMSKNAATTY